MVYEFVNTGYAFPPDIFAGIFSRDFTHPLLAAISVTAVAVFWLNLSRDPTATARSPLEPHAIWANPILVVGLSFVVLFLHFATDYAVSDEVMINLEHSYNLHHFGRFSMSPSAMVDGTVEYAFYLLHAPFGETARSLLLANYLMSFLVCAAALAMYYWLSPIRDAALRALMVLTAALFPPLVLPLATGFGNGLIVVLFLGAALTLLRGKWRTAATLSALMPLVRPDGLMWSLLLAGAVALSAACDNSRDEPLGRKIRRVGLFAVPPVVATLAFFAFTDVLYGHAIPTPLAFKGIVLSSVLFHTIPLLAATVGDVLRTLVEPGLLLVSIAVAPLVLHSLARDRTLLREGQWSFAVFIFAAAAIGWAVTELSSRAVGWSGNAYDRYGAVLFPTLLVLYAVGLETLQGRGLRAYTRALGALVPAVLALLIVTDKTPLPREGKFSNRTWAYDAGALTQAIVAPTDMVVSTSEMNTFGLAIADRQVLDFWGYTNPAIAHSHLCNGDRYRIAPDEFLRVGPDIYWPYIFTHEPTYDYDSMEIGLAEFHHVNHEGNNLGDMMKVMALYDVVVAMAGERQVVYLVRKERVQLVSGRLAQLGFRLTRTRAFDTDAFRTMYESLPITTFPC